MPQQKKVETDLEFEHQRASASSARGSQRTKRHLLRAGVTMVHGAIYQLLETREAIFVVLFVVLAGFVAMFQVMAFRRIRA